MNFLFKASYINFLFFILKFQLAIKITKHFLLQNFQLLKYDINFCELIKFERYFHGSANIKKIIITNREGKIYIHEC
jgi:hypothetical protein